MRGGEGMRGRRESEGGRGSEGEREQQAIVRGESNSINPCLHESSNPASTSSVNTLNPDCNPE